MSQIRRYGLGLALLHAAALQAAEPARLEALADSLDAKVIAWRRDVHEHPELGNRETRTAKLVADHLRSLGLKPETGIAHTGVVALLEGGRPGKRVALRADMDALPVTERNSLPFASKATAEFRGEKVGVMHACGHDTHVAMLMGVAEALVAMKDELAGSVLFVFQPAEEGPPEGEEGGAELMIKEGVLEKYKPDAVLGMHVFSTLAAGTLGVRSGPIMAESDMFTIVVTGRQTHGARPWGGVDPIVAAAHVVTALQTVVSRETDITGTPAVVSVGSIKGGIRYNIIPDSVEMVGTIRTFEIAQRDQIYADIRRIAEHTAQAHGATATITITQRTPVTSNDPALTAQLRPSLEAVAGKDKVIDSALVTGAEDFGEFSKLVPGMYFYVGATAPGIDPATAPSNHSPEFMVDEASLGIGMRAMLRATVDYLTLSAP
ncbi:MAG TPA: amidohydrolase [Candidatus Saccharimonadia bacterium]|nr:amidohydrolase [Candidatus Saccharimonadia bacterium]